MRCLFFFVFCFNVLVFTIIFLVWLEFLTTVVDLWVMVALLCLKLWMQHGEYMWQSTIHGTKCAKSFNSALWYVAVEMFALVCYGRICCLWLHNTVKCTWTHTLVFWIWPLCNIHIERICCSLSLRSQLQQKLRQKKVRNQSWTTTLRRTLMTTTTTFQRKRTLMRKMIIQRKTSIR